jgi:hypothetical protein
MNVRGQNRQSGQRKGSVDGSPSVYLLGFTLLYGWIDGTAARAFGTNERNGRIPTYLPTYNICTSKKQKERKECDGWYTNIIRFSSCMVLLSKLQGSPIHLLYSATLLGAHFPYISSHLVTLDTSLVPAPGLCASTSVLPPDPDPTASFSSSS